MKCPAKVRQPQKSTNNEKNKYFLRWHLGIPVSGNIFDLWTLQKRKLRKFTKLKSNETSAKAERPQQLKPQIY